MAEDKPVKPKSVKGVDTTSSSLPEFRKETAFRAPKTEEEAYLSELGSIGFESKGQGITGTDFLLSKRAKDLYTAVDLAKGIPDQWEREKFISKHGSNMVKVLDSDKYGIRFNHQIEDYAAYKEKQYDVKVKQFLDQLDQNQGFIESSVKTASKLIGKTALSVGSLVPTVYGLGSALFNWDSQKIFNNTLFDAWETMDQGLDKHLVVYGGSDYHEGDKNIFARMMSHPMKSINNDIAPAVAFVAGAVLTEMAATALAPVTGGTVLAANTARLAATAHRVFGRAPRLVANLGIETANIGINTLNKGLNATKVYSKGLKTIRGLDTIADVDKAAQIASMTGKYRAGLGTLTSMVRSGAYESTLIARGTYDGTLEESKVLYLEGLVQKWEQEGKSQQEIQSLLQNPDAVIPAHELAKMQKAAEQASELAWFSNVPLVGFSNMIQFSKAFSSGYKINKSLEKLNPFRLTGTVQQGGKQMARIDTLSKGRKLAGYGVKAMKTGVVEGFEEFAQGVIEEGYTDYYSAQFSPDAVKSSVGFLQSMTTAARNYAGSTEGFDSMTIGFLMGMMGIRLPVRINQQTGKVERGWESYGGVRQEIKDLKAEITKDRARAEFVNNNPLNPVLKANFENTLKNITIQAEMDKALEKGDVFTFKNKEYEQLHSLVGNRIQNEVEDTLYQDLDSYEALPLDQFNEQFAHKGVYEFTEETKKTALAKTRQNIDTIIKAHKQVDALFSDYRYGVDFWRKNWKGLEDPLQLTSALQEQMTYLYGSTMNMQARENEVSDQIRNISDNKLNPDISNKIIAELAALNTDNKAEFATQARQMYHTLLNEWQENDPVSYNLHNKEVAPLLKDLIEIKARKAKLSKMYDVLFTKAGTEDFVKTYVELHRRATEAQQEMAVEASAEEMANAKSATTSKAAAKDAASVGAEDIANSVLEAEMQNAEGDLSELLGDTKGVASPSDAGKTASIEEIIATVQKNPGLFNKILEQLDKNDILLPGLTDIDLLDEVMATNPLAAGQFIEAYLQVVEDFRINKPVDNVVLDYANPEDRNQPAPDIEEATSIADRYAKKSEDLKASSIYQPGSNVSHYSIIPVLHDKEIVDSKPLRDPKTGEFVSKIDTDHPIDVQLINSPDFLPNSKLQNETILATFQVEETAPYKDPFTGEMVEITDKNIRVNVYHNDVFIGRLPAFREGMPANFLALRQAIINQERSTSKEELIEEKFDTIIEQLIKAKVNVFFNENNEFKKCD